MTTATTLQPTERERRVASAEAYVRTRFYPALPVEYGEYAVRAIDACNDRDPGREILLKRDLPLHPRGGTYYGDRGPVGVTAESLVDALHLWHMVEDDELDEHDCTEHLTEYASEVRHDGSFDVWDRCDVCGTESGHRRDSVV